jgi:SAM-dependent methyltransferase
MTPTIDEQAVREFATKLLGLYTGSSLTYMLAIGHATGLFETAARGSGSSADIARRAGLDERYVREWLSAMVTGGIFTYDPANGAYALPTEHALCLTGPNARNLAPLGRLFTLLGKHVPAVTECFSRGGGVPAANFVPDFYDALDDIWRRIYDSSLIDGFLAAAPPVVARLQAGARVADIGCGTGHAVALMARAFPRSTFVGYDVSEHAIEAARAEAEEMGLANARFDVLDVAKLPPNPRFDVITAFDAIHDQVDPAGVLRRVYEALEPDGMFFAVEFKFSSKLEDNVGNPFAALYSGLSVMYCMTVSLAEGGCGLGSMWGTQRAQAMLTDAGFRHIEVFDSPRPQNCLYLCNK